VPKNIVICCDGTANEFTQHNTNVVKLYYTLDQSPDLQVTYYHPGLGTMEPAGALTPFARKFYKALGMALGYGLSDDVARAYTFLMETYQEGDKVFFFGFSRGAYTVRSVCSLLHMYGLIRPLNESLVPYAIQMMLAIQRARRDNPKEQEAVRQYFELAAAFKQYMSRTDCNPWFVGVWDTVSSVGWISNPLKFRCDSAKNHGCRALHDFQALLQQLGATVPKLDVVGGRASGFQVPETGKPRTFRSAFPSRNAGQGTAWL
jgi:uncharacterized protein (DUF2235 family)